eukprot:5988008-Amphidinium_carterae.1
MDIDALGRHKLGVASKSQKKCKQCYILVLSEMHPSCDVMLFNEPIIPLASQVAQVSARVHVRTPSA